MNKDSHLPRYIIVKEAILESIDSGKFELGSMIPSLNQLTKIYKVSDTTIKKALSMLINEGVLRSEWGKGVFVASRYTNNFRRVVTLIVWSGNKELNHPHFVELNNGIMNVLGSTDFSLEFIFLDPLTMNDKEIERRISNISQGGVLIPFIPSLRATHLMPLIEKNVPVVFITKGFQEISPYLVTPDSFSAIAELAGMCVKAGKKNIAVIGSPRDEFFYNIKNAIEEGGDVVLSEQMIKRGDYGIDSGASLMKEFLKEKVIPDIIIADDEFAGYGVLTVLKNNKIPVPQKIQVLGIGGFSKYYLSDCKLGTVSIPFFDMGRKAVSMLLKIISGREPQKKKVVLTCCIEGNDTFNLKYNSGKR